MDSPPESYQHDSIENKPVIPRLQLTLEQKNDIKATFDLLDPSGSGTIDAEKFRVTVSALGYEMTREELKIRLRGLDIDLNEKLSLEQFTTLLVRKIADRDSEEEIVKSFLMFDTDDTGVISFENIQEIAKILGESLTDEEISEMIDEFDDTGNGVVTLDQFTKMINKSVHLQTL